MKKKKILDFMVLLIICRCLVAAAIMADDFDIRPSIHVRQEYNDNIYFSYNNILWDYITTIIPQLEVSNRTERMDLTLFGQLAPFFYRHNSDLNDMDQAYRCMINYQFSPLFRADLNGSYIVDNRPDRDQLETGLVQSSDRRRRLVLGTHTQGSLNENMNFLLSYDYRRDKWQGDDPDLFDMESHSGDLEFAYDIGRWIDATTGLLNVGFFQYDYETSQTLSMKYTAGFELFFNEIFYLDFGVGANYSDSTFNALDFELVPSNTILPAVMENSNKRWDIVGTGVLGYRGETTRYNFTASHDLNPTSGRLGPNRLTRFVFDIRQRFWEEMSWGLSTGYYINKAKQGEYSAQGIDQYTFRFIPNLQWEFVDDIILEVAYNLSFIEDKLRYRDKRQHIIFLQISYGFSLMELSDLF